MKVFVWLLLCLIWGTTWFFIKIGLQDLPPISYAGVRFVTASLILLVIIWRLRIALPKTRNDWQLLAVTGFLQFSLNYSFVFWSEQYISSGLAAVLQATIPAFGLLMAGVHLPWETITLRKFAAVALGIGGVAIIFYEQLRISDAMAFAGSVAIVVGAFAAAEASILVKSRGAALHPLSLLCGQMICGLIPVVIFAVLKEGNPLRFNWTTRAVFSVIYLAVMGTIVAFWLYYWLLSKVESAKAMTISLVTPLVAVTVGALALGEKFPAQTLVGGAFILGSVSLIALKRPRQAVDRTYQAAD